MVKNKTTIFMFVGLIILISLGFVCAVRINEVMANTPTATYGGNCEWVELYSGEVADLTGWTLDTNGQSTTLNSIIADYLIITKDKALFLENWDVDDENKVVEWISMGLNNGGDNVIVLNKNEGVVDEMSYDDSDGDLSWQFCNGNWIENGPNPGKINLCGAEPDVTGNGKVNIEDLVLVRVNLGNEKTYNADFNEDGLIDDEDMEMIEGCISGGTCEDVYDLNGDGAVDGLDIIELTKEYGRNLEIEKADVNNDGIINIQDLIIVREYMGMLVTEQEVEIVAKIDEEIRGMAVNYDVNRDGKINLQDLVLIRVSIGMNVTRENDLNGDFRVDWQDVELMKRILTEDANPTNEKYDLNEDGIIDEDDYDKLYEEYLSNEEVRKIDINGNGIVNGNDYWLFFIYLGDLDDEQTNTDLRAMLDERRALGIIIYPDTDGNDIVNILDLMRVRVNLNVQSNALEDFDVGADVNRDGIVDLIDLGIVKLYLGYEFEEEVQPVPVAPQSSGGGGGPGGGPTKTNNIVETQEDEVVEDSAGDEAQAPAVERSSEQEPVIEEPAEPNLFTEIIKIIREFLEQLKII